jgi:hypothetical protein
VTRKKGAATAHRRNTGTVPGVEPATSAIRWRAAVVVLAGLLVYGNSLSGPFLFDDQNSIVRNPQIRELWPVSTPLSPPRDTPVAGRPLVNFSFAINYAIHGTDVVGYHLVNIAIHLLAAVTLFGVVRRTLNLSGPASLFGGTPTNLAWASALIWMLHPLQTEPVNYLSERTESMMGLFYLLTLYCGIRAHERRNARTWQLGAIVSCAAGMACKESMVTAPLMVFVYDRIFVFDSFRASMRARGSFYTGLWATWLVLLALVSSTPRTSVGFGAGTSAWVYLLNQLELLAQYLRLTIWPRALVLDYGLPRPLALRDVLPQATLAVGLGLAVLVALARRPQVGFLGAWFFVTLAPTTSLVPIATEVGAERRMYLPLAALVVLATTGWYLMTRRHRAAAVVAAAVVCTLLGAGTVLRNREYQSRLSIAQTVVERWPSGRGRYILGVELLRVGRRLEGMAALRAAAPEYPAARYALGTELFGEGSLDAAIDELRVFVREFPSHPNTIRARDQLGRAFLVQGRLDEAMQEFTIVLTQPDYPLRWEVASFIDKIRAVRRGSP